MRPSFIDDDSIEVVKIRSIQISERTSVVWSQNMNWQRARETNSESNSKCEDTKE